MNELKKWLTINSLFSSSSGILMLVLNQYLQRIFGFNISFFFPAIGINLILFAAFVFFVRKHHLHNKKWIYTICILDALWVIGSVILFIIHPVMISPTAYIITGIVAIFVGIMAIMQFKTADHTSTI
jgi:glucose uptake protein GlcU